MKINENLSSYQFLNANNLLEKQNNKIRIFVLPIITTVKMRKLTLKKNTFFLIKYLDVLIDNLVKSKLCLNYRHLTNIKLKKIEIKISIQQTSDYTKT